jgi:hypothetical protein
MKQGEIRLMIKSIGIVPASKVLQIQDVVVKIIGID